MFASLDQFVDDIEQTFLFLILGIVARFCLLEPSFDVIHQWIFAPQLKIKYQLLNPSFLLLDDAIDFFQFFLMLFGSTKLAVIKIPESWQNPLACGKKCRLAFMTILEINRGFSFPIRLAPFDDELERCPF